MTMRIPSEGGGRGHEAVSSSHWASAEATGKIRSRLSSQPYRHPPELRQHASIASSSHGCYITADRNDIHSSFGHRRVTAACLPLWVDSTLCCLSGGMKMGV